ncbi:MAG: hypothetical protein EZS28_012261 [Streblomastix strix]|uniref:Uncharacterized protein n=1 Tax=Streblomastix strix TaxID=222440 RepID=A0A5J4WBE2_9EUKA|nr:MAG: hypothetical protein EZS28_012261 [Streblomastix strix]
MEEPQDEEDDDYDEEEDNENEAGNINTGQTGGENVIEEAPVEQPLICIPSTLAEKKAYMAERVYPFLKQALAELARANPPRPLIWLATYMKQNNPSQKR